MAMRRSDSAAPAITNDALRTNEWSSKAPITIAAYIQHGKAMYQSQSSITGRYPTWRRAWTITLAAKPRPIRPQTTRAIETPSNDGQGALMIAETSSAPPRWTTVGVPNALMVPEVVRVRVSLISAMTTNCNPMSAAPDEPTMT